MGLEYAIGAMRPATAPHHWVAAQQDDLRLIIEPCLELYYRENESLEAKEKAVGQAYVGVLEVLSPEQKRMFLRASE